MQAKLDRFCAYIVSGLTREDAAAELGVGTNVISQWEKRYTGFTRAYAAAKAKRKGTFVPEFTPFDAEFRERYMHHSTPSHLQALMDIINTQATLAEQEGSRDRRILILLPPESAKSTLLEEYVSYRIAMDPGFRSSIVCATQGQARKRLGAIARRLTDRSEYAELIDNYGPFQAPDRIDAKPWTANYFTTLHAPAAQRDYTCQGLGWTGSIYGDRQNLIVCDDIADLKNQTPAEIEKQWEKLWGEFRSRLVKGGLFVVIGTHMREDDIYTVMRDRGFFSEVIIMPAISREPGTLSDEDPGECIWPEQTSMQELLKIRETDLRMFELMYQQNPLPSIGAVFTAEAIQACHDEDRYVGHIPDGCIVVAGVDPSIVNFTAGVVMAVNPKSGMRYLVDAWAEKGLTGEGGDKQAGVVEFIIELCRAYRVHTLVVENNSWAPLINTSLTLKRSLYDLNVRHFGKAIGPASGVPEETAIGQLSGLFNHGLISIPASRGSLQHLAPFTHQLLAWSGTKTHWRKNQDIIKAFRMAEHAAKTVLTGGANSKNDTDPLTPEFMRRRVRVGV
jgi:hypothetical protein